MEQTDRRFFDELAEYFLDRYDFGTECMVKLLQLSENYTFLIFDKESGQKKGVMRISRPGYHTLSELHSELIWLKEIKKNTPIVVADAIPAVDGSCIQTVTNWKDSGEYICMVYEFLEGKAPDESDEQKIVKEFCSLGETTAYLHKQVKEWNDAGKIDRFVWDYDTMIGKTPRWGRWQDAKDMKPDGEKLLNRTCEVIKRRLCSYGKGKDRFGLIHADLRISNLLIEDNQIKVIDFDDCGYGWFLHDLASAVSFIEDNPIVPELIDSWLEGYRKIAELTQEDIHEIDTFIMQRRLQLLAWLTSHIDSDPVKQLNTGYYEGTIKLADRYLTKYE